MEQAQQPAVDHRPYGFWKESADQMRADAATMSNAQMAEKYQTTRKHIKETLPRLGIKRDYGRVDWAARLDELKKLAVTMTAQQLAAHFKTTAPNIYNRLFLSGIEAASGRPTHKFEGGLKSFALAAPTMTEAELCAHFSIVPRTVRKHLKRLAIECKPVKKGPRAWTPHKEELEQLVASGWSFARLSEHYGVSDMTMRRAAKRLGVEIASVERAPKAPRVPAAKKPAVKKAAPSKKTTPVKKAAPQPVLVRRSAPKPAAPKRPVEIIVPADVKVTIADFNPPPGMRICNGTQTQNYSPALHGGVMRSMR